VFTSWAIAIHSFHTVILHYVLSSKSFFFASGRGLFVTDALGCTTNPRIMAAILPTRPSIRRKRDHSMSIKRLRILRSSRWHDRRCQPRSTKEQIIYPATGGNTYGSLAQAGVLAVKNQVTNFSTQCPGTRIVLVGYSQGAQIMDNTMCGGGDLAKQITNSTAPISAAVAAWARAVILMGDLRHTPGAPYNVGNSTDPGVSCSYLMVCVELS
jgi:hypothetical protein